MFYRLFYISVLFTFVTSCQTHSFNFWSAEPQNGGKPLFQSYSCDQLIDAADRNYFSLKNLAALQAAIRGCKNISFEPDQLTEFEKRLYSTDLNQFLQNKGQARLSDQSPQDLISYIKKSENPSDIYSAYKQLRLKVKARANNREDYVKVTDRMYKWALKNYTKNSKSSEAAAIYYDAAQVTIKTYWTNNEVSISNKVLKNSLHLLLTKQSVAELLYLRGRIFEESKNFDSALIQYNLTIDDINKYKPSGLSFNLDRILWLKSWILYKQKKYSEAEESFSKLANSTTDLSEKSRALFFQSRCLSKLDKSDEAKKLLNQVIETDFFGYYGLVAYNELGIKFPPFNSLKAEKKLSYDLNLSFLSSKQKNFLEDLIEHKEFALADRFATIVAKEAVEELNISLYLAKKYQFYLPLFKVYSRLDNSSKIDAMINFPDLIYPRPYQEKVKEMSEKTQLPPSLIYSIMKQESAFNTKARSQANAMGLMQVIPTLAKRLSKKFDVPFEATEDLYRPHINIQLGSYELMEQVKKQKGQLTFVAAAYNAGPNALSNWVKTRHRKDMLEFIEEIPYEETRTYVKLIARNKIFYERISNRDKELDFPVNFLD